MQDGNALADLTTCHATVAIRVQRSKASNASPFGLSFYFYVIFSQSIQQVMHVWQRLTENCILRRKKLMQMHLITWHFFCTRYRLTDWHGLHVAIEKASQVRTLATRLQRLLPQWRTIGAELIKDFLVCSSNSITGNSAFKCRQCTVFSTLHRTCHNDGGLDVSLRLYPEASSCHC